jgi:hypothetical protein
MALRLGTRFPALTLPPPADPAVSIPGTGKGPMAEDLTRA